MWLLHLLTECKLSYLDSIGALDEDLTIEWELDDNGTLANHGAKRAHFSEAMKVFARTLFTSRNSFKTVEDLMEAENAQLSVDFGKWAIRATSELKRQYATSRAEDEDLLENPDIQGRLRMAIEVRLAEKDLLDSASDVAGSI